MQQRQPFPPPQKSPELFHPRPQHISQVPMMRSPPPPVSQIQNQQQPPVNSYGNPFSNPSAGGGMGQGFGGFMNDPTAQMGFQVGKTAVAAGQEYMEQNFNRYVPVSALKHYFNVSNSYVVRKLLLVLFPWRHKPWTRQQTRMSTSSTNPDGHISQQSYSLNYLPPRDDLNSPDMYIPIMALVTYILLSTVLAGIRGSFHPELLGSITSTALVVIVVEFLVLRVAMYFLAITNDSQFLDLFAYSGYKFVGVIVTLFLSELLTGGRGTNNWVGWTLFVYTWYANAFFLLRSLKYVLLPDTSNDPTAMPGNGAPYTMARTRKNQRTYFLAIYAFVIQMLFMWLLSREESAVKTVANRITGPKV
ncbi:uncharacterized protein A1O9_03156 [Exophiala aquamarina CBS 119918]|uniref:Protein YIF1 n=1 Tax=Exophiala aquamarina CBS 119918 TaxID=1182545 RepID=A0A072PQG4_9EURO|nr:uncharacterized protein A1O9_03156 [Exophiala aquamarina CBS 119918]KEF61588.1 hypothetical protein A1O9_03156 [Exophiala aquamarina CBS 119918]